MTSDLFEREATRYESWYETPSGRRIAQAEAELVDWLLARLPASRLVLDVGCGTGHFTGLLAAGGRTAIGLDRSPAMLAEARRRLPATPLVLADAQRLPVRDGAVDAVLLVATLEFLADPDAALAEAARVARHGVAVVALHRFSLGGMSRRWGRHRRSPILGAARDCSRRSLRRALTRAAGARLAGLDWTSSLFPGRLWHRRLRVAVGGDVLGMVAVLADPSPRARGPSRPA